MQRWLAVSGSAFAFVEPGHVLTPIAVAAGA